MASRSDQTSKNNTHGAVSASIRNKQRSFAPIQTRTEAAQEHPLFKSSATAKLFPALAAVPGGEVAAMFGLPPIDKHELRQQYLVDRSDPFHDRPGIYSREAARGGGGNNNSPPLPHGTARTSSLPSPNSTMPKRITAGGGAAAAADLEGGDEDERLRRAAKARMLKPFIVSRMLEQPPAQSVYAGCNFEGDERRENQKKRAALHGKMREKGQPFVVRAGAYQNLERHEFVNSVDDETLDLLKEYMFSGRAAVDDAARKRTTVDSQRTAKRRQRGIRQQQQQHRTKQLREKGEVQYAEASSYYYGAGAPAAAASSASPRQVLPVAAKNNNHGN